MPHETKIFLVRHGETEWNEQSRLQGSLNSPLTQKGIQQARDVGETLNSFHLDHAYVSPLKRAQDTLEIILEDRDLTITITDNLREINLGPWEGKTRQQTSITHPDEYIAFWEKQDTFKLAGAETFKELQDRMVKELDFIFTDNNHKNILVVSHWIAIKVALAHYLSKSLSELSKIDNPKNGGVICLCKRGNEIRIQI